MAPTLERPVSERDLKSKIRYETLTALCENGMTSFAITMLNGGLTWYTLRNVADPVVLLTWVAAIITLSALRMLLVAWFWRLQEDSSSLRPWTALYLVSIYASGIGWGILASLAVFNVASWTETFIIFLIAGMSAGGLITLYPLLLAAVPYLLLILTPLIFHLSTSGAPAHSTMAIIASLYLVLLIRATFTLNASATKSIRLEMENEELFKFLLKARQ